MKKIIPLFLLALAPLAASAAWNCTIKFDTSAPLRYSYAADEDEKDALTGDKLVQNEIIRVLLVNDTRTDTSTLPFTIDMAGQLIPAEGLTADHMAWMELGWYIKGVWIEKQLSAFIGEIPGIPNADDLNSVDSKYAIKTSYSKASLAGGTSGTAYLVLFDTCCQGACSGEYERIFRYAVSRVPGKVSYIPSFGASTDVACVETVAAVSTEMLLPGLIRNADGSVSDGWLETEDISSLTVEIDGTQQTLIDTELEDYLSPEIASATFTDPESVTLLSTAGEVVKTLQIQASSTDIVCYTLYTATSLDGEWTTFDALLEEKGVDTADKKEYTRFRIDGESKTITIPVFDDATRFYQLRMDN